MLKKIIALSLICAMLVPLSPAVAADETTVTPTIEEILNSYHNKAFEAQSAEKNGGASTYARGGSNQTLEQETVAELTEAGYEAYNVTGENYEALEDALNTDFAAMGLDPASSYVVVISGEDPAAQSNPNPRVLPPAYDDFDGDDGGGGEGDGHTYFEYVYDEKTYYMRYVTVTAAENAKLGVTSSVELLSTYGVTDMLEDLNIPITISTSLGLTPITGTLYSIASCILPYTNPQANDSLEYRGATSWIVTYVQVYNSNNEKWVLGSGYEYATMRYFLTYTYYDPVTQQFEQKSTSGTHGKEYSKYYYDRTAIKNWAAYAFEHNARLVDKITYVEYLFKGEVVLTHYRWNEHSSYEPA